MSDKRIIELDVTDVVEADDFLAIDSVSGKTRRIKPIKIGATYEIEDGDHNFTLVGSNGYRHTVDIPYDSVSMTQAEYNALTPEQKADGTTRFITDGQSDVESELWSKVGRQTLDTDSQVLSNAVNELVNKTNETNDIVGDGQQSVGTDLTDAVTQLNSSLETTNTNLDNLSKLLLVGSLNDNGSITLSPNGGSHLLIISRANNNIYCGLVFDYWGTDIKVAFGTLPSNLMVGKNASTNNVSITNHLGYSVAYTLV